MQTVYLKGDNAFTQVVTQFPKELLFKSFGELSALRGTFCFLFQSLQCPGYIQITARGLEYRARFLFIPW